MIAAFVLQENRYKIIKYIKTNSLYAAPKNELYIPLVYSIN